MKKNKKNTKKATRYNGYNAFGDRCIAKTAVLKKETALVQYLEALADIDTHDGERIEYTFALGKDFTREEAEAFWGQMKKIAEFRAKAQSKPFSCRNCSGTTLPLAI